METVDLMLWANRQHPRGTRAVGESTAVRVLVALCAYANQRGEAWPSVATLAADVDLPARTVRGALDVLRDDGLIEAVESPRPGRVTRWRIAATSRDIPHGGAAATSRATSRGTSRDIPRQDEEKTGLTTSRSQPQPHSARATAVEKPRGPLDVARLRADRPDLARLSDPTLRTLAAEVLQRARGGVRNETAYVLTALREPEWEKRGDELEWQQFEREGAGREHDGEDDW